MRSPLPKFPTTVGLVAFLSACGGSDSPVRPDPVVDEPPVPLVEWSWLNPLPPGASLNGVAVRGERAIAVGDDGVVLLGNRTLTDVRIVDIGSRGLFLADVGFLSDDVIVAVGENGTMRSADGGETWRSVDDTRIRADLAIRGARVVGVGGTRVVRSNDGENFLQGSYPGDRPLSSVAFADDTTVFAVTANEIWKSDDTGATWEEVTPSNSEEDLSSLRVIAFATPSIGVIAADDPPRVLRTVDGGRTWSFADEIRRDAREIQFFGADLGILMTFGRDIYVSFDAGQTWIQRSEGDFDQGFRAASFADRDEFLAVGQDGRIERSSNGGVDWVESSSGLRKSIFDLEFTSARSGVALSAASDDHFLLRTEDGGVTWTEEPAPLGTAREITFFDASLGAMLDFDGTVSRTDDGGRSWKATGAESTVQFFVDIAFRDRDTWIIVGVDGTILRTTDGGDTWNVEAIRAGGPVYTAAAFFPGTDVGLALGRDGGVRSEDGGDAWVELDVESPVASDDVVCPTSDVAVAVGNVIQRSTDRGLTWTTVFSDSADRFSSVAFRNEAHGIAVTEAGEIYESLDGGVTWVEVENPFDRLNAVAFRDGRSAVVAGSKGVVGLGRPVE